jgi:hypothetical protein
MLVVGDSTALATGNGLVLWAQRHPDVAVVQVEAEPGCGIITSAELWLGQGWGRPASKCAGYLGERIPELVASLAPDVVVVITSSWDVIDHRWEDGVGRGPNDEEFQRRAAAEYADFNDMLLSAGSKHVVWVLHPRTDPFWGGVQDQAMASRHMALHHAMREASALRASEVGVVDLMSWSTSDGIGEDHDARPDGVHWTFEAALDVAERFLGPEIVSTIQWGAVSAGP